MFSKAISANLDKMAARQLTYIVAFALFCVIRNGLFSWGFGVSIESVRWPIVAFDVITFGIIIGIVLSTVHRKILQGAVWGFQLRPGEWLVIGFICAAGVYFAINTKWLTIANAAAGLLIVIQFITYELVFRALLMKILLKIWGDSLKSVLLTALISALVYGAILLPMELHPGMTVGVLLVLNYLFCLTRSIILFTFLVAGYAAPDECGVWVALFSIIIYLGLTLMVRKWEKEDNRIDYKATPGRDPGIDPRMP
jgi:hypothetical protein